MNSSLWDRLKMRLEQLCYSERGAGCGWLAVELLVVNGELRGWRRPQITPIEPYSQRESIAEVEQMACEKVDATG